MGILDDMNRISVQRKGEKGEKVYILYTVCCMLYAVYCMLYAVYCMLYAVYCILYTVYCILYTVYCILYTIYCILYTVYPPPSPLPDLIIPPLPSNYRVVQCGTEGNATKKTCIKRVGFKWVG